MTTASIPTNALQALAISAAVKNIRYLLNGVFFHGDYACSTDGGRLLRVWITTEGIPQVIIPIETVKAAIKLHSKKPSIELKYENDQFSLGGIAFTPVEGKFFDIDRVIPDHPDPVLAGVNINPDYLQDALRQINLLGEKSYFAPLKQQRDEPRSTMVHSQECFTIVIMPVRI